MRSTDLPSPGHLSMGIGLQREAAKAISSIQVRAAGASNNKAVGADQLAAFFSACASAASAFVGIPTYVGAPTPPAITPVVVSATVPAGSPAVIRLQFNTAMDVGTTPTAASFSLLGTMVNVVGAAWDNQNTLSLLLSAPVTAADDGMLISYTQERPPKLTGGSLAVAGWTNFPVINQLP